MSFTSRKSFSRKSTEKPPPASISTSRSAPIMPQPLSPASRFGFSNSASARNLSSHPLDSPAAGSVGTKKSPSPSTASTARSGDSHGSSGKSGSSLPSIRSLGARFGFGRSPSGGKKSLPVGGANTDSEDGYPAAQQPPTASRIPMSPTSPRSPVPPVPALPPLFARASLEPTPTPLSPRLAQLAVSEAQSTRHSVDGTPSRSRTSSVADSHSHSRSRSSLNLPARRDSSPGGSSSGSLLRAPLGSLSRSNSWIAPSFKQASRERIDEEGESQVVNVNEIGEIAAGAGVGGNGELVVDLTSSVTIRGPQRSHSRPDSVLDKPLPTPPLQSPITLKSAIKRTPDLKSSPLPGSTAMGVSLSHLTVSPNSQQATPSPSSFSATPIMNGSPLLPKGVLGELARELKNVAESPSTKQLLRARASAVELSRPVSSVNADGQGVSAQLGLLELKGAVERMRAMVEELEKGVTAGPVAFEAPTERAKEETAVLDRSDSDLVAILTPKLEDPETPKVPLPPDPEPTPVPASTPTRVHFLANAPATPPTAAMEEPTPIVKNNVTRRVEVHDEHDDPHDEFQPGAESSPALSRRNPYRHVAASTIRTSTNARRTGRPSIDFPHDEEEVVLVGRGLGRVPFSRGSAASPTPSLHDGRQSPFRPGPAASRVLGRNTIASSSTPRDRPPIPAWEGPRKYLPSGTDAGVDRRGSGTNSPAPGSAGVLAGSQFYHRRALSTLARPTASESTRSPLNHSRNLRSVGSFDESREWNPSNGTGGQTNSTNVPGKRLSDLSTGLGPRTARAFAAAGVLPSNYKSPTGEKDFRTLERERATSSMSARRDPTTGSISDRLGTWSRLGFSRARSDIAGHQSSPPGATAGTAFSDSTTTSSPTSSGAPRAAVSSLSTVSSTNSGPSTTNIPVSNHQAIISSLKERHELETEALLNALSQAKKESKALREVNGELKGEIEGLTKFVEELEERLAGEVAKRKTVERQLEDQKRSNERRVGNIPPIPRSESPLWRRKEKEERSPSLLRESLPKKPRPGPPPERLRGTPRIPSSSEDESTQDHIPIFSTTAPTPERTVKQQRHRSGSFASSIALPVMSDSMTLLLEETPGMAGIRVNHDNRSFKSTDSPPPSPTLAVGKSFATIPSADSPARTITHRRETTPSTSPVFQTAARPISRRQGGLRTPTFDHSPTSSMDYSFMPASPGSLVLRDEDDRHLADLASVIHDDSHDDSN